MKLPGDNPIKHAKDDTCGRTPLAESFVRSVQALDVSEGSVVGVLGPWGSGKTSFVNLTRNILKRSEIEILDFNPWMFSGSEQLVQTFFVELAAQLKIRLGLHNVAEALQDYGEAVSGLGWLPVVGPWIERTRGVAKILAKALERRREGIDGRRKKLLAGLSGLPRPICVVLDDIDRLSTSEIRDIFRLVRLTASFPNVIYIVAFDRCRVERALDEDGVSGRDYIEKILQLSIDLPCLPGETLMTHTLDAINSIVSGFENAGPVNDGALPDVFAEVVRPLIRNMRDVRRFSMGLHWTLASLGGQIAIEDVLALEAVRVFLPDVFGQFHGAAEALTSTVDDARGNRAEDERHKSDVQSLLKAAGPHGGVIEALVDRVFPAAKQHLGTGNYDSSWKASWLKHRKVAHLDIFRLYLERTATDRLQACWEAETAFSVLDKRDKLEGFLRSIEGHRRVDVISGLEAFQSEFAPPHVVPGTVALLNLIEDLPDRQRGLGDFGSRVVVVRAVLRLLRCLGSERAIELAVREALPELNSLSAKLELVRIVGHQENVGLKLLPPEIAEQLEREWRDGVRNATADDLAEESDAAKILLVARRQSTEEVGPIRVPDDPRVTLAILRDVRSEAIGQTMGSRAIRREPRLAWGALVDLYGDEATVRARVDDLKRADLPGSDDVIQLADMYLEGWRPEE